MAISGKMGKAKTQKWTFPVKPADFRVTLTDGIYIHRSGAAFFKAGPELVWHRSQMLFDCSRLGREKARDYAFFVARVHRDLAKAGYFHPETRAVVHDFEKGGKKFFAVSLLMPRLETLPNLKHFRGEKREEWTKRVSEPVSILKNYLNKRGLLSKVHDIDLEKAFPEKNPSDNFGIDPETGDIHAIDIGLWTKLPPISKFRKAFPKK